MPAELRQSQRLASFTTPSGKDEFALIKFEAEEALSELFTYKIEATSKTENADLVGIIGEKCSVKMILKDQQERIFHGILIDAQWLGRDDDLHVYRFVLRPWLWLLSQRTDCRIFRNKTPLDIIGDIFKKEGKASFEDRVSDKPDEVEYCVQYRETDLDFVLRLMEQYGIYYYFKHTDANHTLILSDSKSAHDPIKPPAAPSFTGSKAGYPFTPQDSSMSRHIEHLTHWSTQRRLRTGKVELRDYNFKESTSDLTSRSEEGFQKAKSYESYDYPGAYTKRNDGERFAKVRAQAVQAHDDRRYAAGEAPSLHPGALMTFASYPTQDENIEYLVVRATHAYGVQNYRSSARADDSIYHGSYELQKGENRFRAPIVTPKPVIYGPHTAKVVGEKNKGEEGDIDVDEYGCIYVRFHWDREDESTSRRVRVAQLWSGKNWGGQIIPRIGQEVVVEFLEGNPDQPLVTGTVVNDQHMPPYELPANKTQSGLKSESTAGAGFSGTYNEVMFEDKMDHEVLGLRAEKDHKVVVRNIETREHGEAFVGPGEYSRVTTLVKGSDKVDIQQGSQLVEALNEIKFRVGDSVIKMTPTGIEITAMTIKINGSITTDVLSDGIMTIKAQLVKIN
ncbi:type VI secretion system tip protein VgrG [Bosea caraganae]|uniref:Type VI secretion system tip protein VgrG n=1 Tax=Bosea caraganae TaxID=2763117 RepID=A0A370L7Q7_9HYPH|nr:type VI secretion system tip protein TssI/VgrG [Bosea caraganae]RDJ24966.1 type VI secretion system tip protein VgrG [Bosea caraganae]RDJ26077.1 type VI secretion system tip protein VgrG [Bosea caraganae]